MLKALGSIRIFFSNSHFSSTNFSSIKFSAVCLKVSLCFSINLTRCFVTPYYKELFQRGLIGCPNPARRQKIASDKSWLCQFCHTHATKTPSTTHICAQRCKTFVSASAFLEYKNAMPAFKFSLLYFSSGHGNKKWTNSTLVIFKLLSPRQVMFVNKF